MGVVLRMLPDVHGQRRYSKIDFLASSCFIKKLLETYMYACDLFAW